MGIIKQLSGAVGSAELFSYFRAIPFAQKIPWAIMASASFLKPAMLAPMT